MTIPQFNPPGLTPAAVRAWWIRKFDGSVRECAFGATSNVVIISGQAGEEPDRSAHRTPRLPHSPAPDAVAVHRAGRARAVDRGAGDRARRGNCIDGREVGVSGAGRAGAAGGVAAHQDVPLPY